MTPHFITANPMARWLSRWRLQRWLLVCGWVLVGWLPGQVQACSGSSMAMFKSDGATMPTTIYFPPTPNATFFNGYLQWTLTNCSIPTTTYNSQISAGNITNNPGLLIANTLIVDNQCEGGFTVRIDNTSVQRASTSISYDCTLKFYFTLKTSSSFDTANHAVNTTLAVNTAFSSAALNNKWAYATGGNTNSVTNSTTPYTFKPAGCSVTTTAPTVLLNTVSSSALAVQTATSNWKAFTIGLNDCLFGGLTSFNILSSFDYTSHSATDTSLIKNTAASGAASNVGVQLATAASDSNVVVSTTNKATQTYAFGSLSSSNTGTTLTLYARLKKASSGSVSAGKVNATATFTVTYQ